VRAASSGMAIRVSNIHVQENIRNDVIQARTTYDSQVPRASIFMVIFFVSPYQYDNIK
jgi:hypothetical protein